VFLCFRCLAAQSRAGTSKQPGVKCAAKAIDMSVVGKANNVNVFVLLGYNFGANSWERKHALGLIPGLNDRLAYGYYRAAGEGWAIEYSHDDEERLLAKYCRLVLRKVLGFDLIHVFRNRQRLLRADIVWTHTELEHLGVLALFKLIGRWRRRPKVVANCIWLFDRWPGLSRVKRFIYRALLREADVVTTFSPENLKAAQRLLPSVRCECILWGALTNGLQHREAATHRPLRILSLGNDMHRDWQTLLRAFGNIDGYEVKIGSSRINQKLIEGIGNVEVISATTANEIRALYEWSDCVVVPLKANLHASGITVIFEAISSGVPSICTDTGGLRAYFSDSEVMYVPTYRPGAMREAADELALDDNLRLGMVTRAREHLISADLTAHGFASRYRRLSEELLRSDSADSRGTTNTAGAPMQWFRNQI
jgi:glycosyltransferase involved in cell wall biosynthesis